jgi:hypothetical protein
MHVLIVQVSKPNMSYYIFILLRCSSKPSTRWRKKIKIKNKIKKYITKNR